jgi:altronate dehydratase small subunit
MLNDAVLINRKDNVATALRGLQKGQSVNLTGSSEISGIVSLESIKTGHKLAIRDIKKGQLIIKYGEAIGAATLDIPVGGHVHIHNVEGRRGRGDLR